MKRLRRLTALGLCMLMIFPARGLTVLAESSPPETADTDAAVPPELSAEESLPEHEMPEENDEYVIYWNPGGRLPDELVSDASPSDATYSDATPANAARGKDSADGRTSVTPVRTLAAAVERAEELMTEYGLAASDIIIYAMNPMEVKDGELYLLNGGNTRIVSWPERPYESDIIFYINGGQLTLVNAIVESGKDGLSPEEPELVRVRGGALQIGQNVTVEGRTVMDYRSTAEDEEWILTATGSDADKVQTAAAVFDIDDYVLATDGDMIELFEDRRADSTWRDAIIELIDGFNGSGYLLEVWDDGEAGEQELVTTLYSDEATVEEFIDCFELADPGDWQLQVETYEAEPTDNGKEETASAARASFAAAAAVLTRKTLIASRAADNNNSEIVYWNPGASMTISNEYFPEGDDTLYDGSKPEAPLKTWQAASEAAKNGIVICMQTVDLGAANAEGFLTRLPGGEFYLASGEAALITSLGTWKKTALPAIRVPQGQTLIVENLFLGGMYDDDGNQESAQNILVNQGDLVINENVRTEDGYIQVNAFYGLSGHPIRVDSIDSVYDGELQVFFGSINKNIGYRYTDVVIPGEELAETIAQAPDLQVRADEIGQALLSRMKLHPANRSAANGGLSDIDWSLRQDTAEDDGVVTAQNIELYTIYYFDGIYIDGQNGSDLNYGATCDFPVKTWTRAAQIWQDEMHKSLAARKAADGEGMNLGEIEKKYPMPEFIYICDTVKVDTASEPEWYLPVSYDYARNEDIRVEVASHIDHISTSGTGSSAQPRHEVPQNLIWVTGSGILNIRDLFIRNSADDTDSVTIRVDSGAVLNFRGDTKLTGTRKASTNFTAKELTLGNHVTVSGGSRFVMEPGWTGSIENCEQGVVASGSSTTVEMNGGFIQKNNSYRADLYAAGSTEHKEGSGVVLSDGARFTMNDGTITGNQTYQYGGGVFLKGNGTTFVMNKGEITANRILTCRVSYNNSTTVYSRGSGIYAGTGTIVTIGNGSGNREDRLISENYSYLAEGTGIYADGSLVIEMASIVNNTAGGISDCSSKPGYGTGIYIGSNGTLAMKGGAVRGNQGLLQNYAPIKGAGIYLAPGTGTHTITESIIADNQTGNEFWRENEFIYYNQGGGIYIGDGNTLTLTKSTVSGNRSGRGGGIYMGGSMGRYTNVTIGETVISGNKAQACSDAIKTGDAGGLFFDGYGNLKLEDGVRVIDNYAYTQGGGIFFTGSSMNSTHLYMQGSTMGAIEISGNTAGASGGGLYQTGGTWHGENVLFSKNTGVTGGGVYVGNAYTYAYVRNVTFIDNKATSGAGLTVDRGNYYLQDCVFTDNTATGQGGAVFVSSSLSKLYLSESADGRFVIRDNHAAYGGGIGMTYAGNLMIDITGPIRNSADIQGSNFYLSGYGNIDIFNGDFRQPAADRQVEGVHNIYIDDKATSIYHKYFDMGRVKVEKKAGPEPEAVFLNTGNSYLTVLAAPADNPVYGTFPIDLNKDVFKSGSIVLKPAAQTSRPMMRPNSDLTAAEADDTKVYQSLADATVNMDYYRGGKLPRRSQLGGFQDSTDSTLTNVIVVGQGVYLAGEDNGGSDSNGGTSPADAVATFGRAKAVLRERIEQTAFDENVLPADEKEGYAPFIYICGQVDIKSNEFWELDYEDSLFTAVNQYYELAEIRHGDPVSEPQVRRFASFVKKPMIQVGNGSQAINFTTGRLIIDGMADAVVLADQGDNSPVIQSLKGTHVILTGDSMVRNNYNNALDIYGDLTLTGETGEVNRQLYNNQTNYSVRLYEAAHMYMLKEARIVTDDTAQTVTGLTSGGIGIMGPDVSVHMSGNSAIVQEAGATLMTRNLIWSDQPNTMVEMKEQARLVVKRGASAGIYVKAADSLVTMSGHAAIITEAGAYLFDGIYAGTGTSVELSGKANIIYSGTRTNACRGVYLDSAKELTTHVKMQDEAAIIVNDSSVGYAGYTAIYCSGGTGSVIEMQNNARIAGTSQTKSSANGIYLVSGNQPAILLNMESTGADDETVTISGMQDGIYLGTAVDSSVSMGKKALITDCTYGVRISAGSDTTSTVRMLMKDQSKICKSNSGIQFYQSNKAAINIRMQDQAVIEQNKTGISENTSTTSTGYGAWQLNIEMFGNARISGHSSSGIELYDPRSNWSEITGTGYQRITLNDNAIIGGTGYYNSEDPLSGNNGAGISANSPVQITMNGSSRISGNGFYAKGESGSAAGISLTRSTTAAYYKAGTARVILNDSASICNNRGNGIYALTINYSDTYTNPVMIEVNGIKSDGSLCTPSIRDNTGALYLGAHTTLKMKGGALVEISDNPFSAENYPARVIDNYGYIELDGRSTIKGLIYLNDSTHPITMTHAAAGNQPKYDLHLVEGFTGRIVVQPDRIGMTDLTGANSQLVYYNKASAEGMADSRPIVEMTPNLVLLGENHVYLSGTGNDAYNGNTPSTAVRTFKRAKELLEGAGYYTAGADIMVCNSSVTVLAGDDDWSFDTGGYVTNTQSGETWRPVITRDKDYLKILVTLPDSNNVDPKFATTVLFGDITVDGGSEQGIVLTTDGDDELLMVGRGRTAILGAGAVFENNKALTATYRSNSAIGVRVYGGTLEINGGTIRNTVRETNAAFTGYSYGSAITVQGVGTDFPAVLVMRSGQITDNGIIAPNAFGLSARFGTIFVGNTNSSADIQGGLIENNKVISKVNDPVAGGAIVNYNGKVRISGGIIRNNIGGCGSMIYHYGTAGSNQLIFSGGQFTGNTTNASGKESTGIYAPIYIANRGFELAGGGADIRDSIYLGEVAGAVKVTDHIIRAGRSYRIFLNPGNGADKFRKGSVIVEPDGDKVSSVSAYLPYFDIRFSPYVLDRGRTGNETGSVKGVTESQCLILMKAVYLDSVDGNDNNTGLTPGQAVKTFTQAKTLGAAAKHGSTQHYVIYVSGTAVNTADETEWTLPDTAYMSRYTGFTVYESDGSESAEAGRAHYGYLIEPAYPLTLRDICVYGRRSNDSTANNGESLVRVVSGITVNVEAGALFADNHNMGNYIADDGLVDNLSSEGGAFYIAAGGTLMMNGGEMKGNSATYGSAVYLQADETDPLSFGRLYLTGTPVISGKVYLDGTSDVTAAYVQPDNGYTPASVLQIAVRNDYNGRPLIRYTDGTVPGENELAYYTFDDAIQALYDIVNNTSDTSILELSLRRVYYLDGQQGSDDESHDGSTPEKAFKSLKRTFEAIGNYPGTNGVLVYVVDTVSVAGSTGEPCDIQLMNIKIYNSDGSSHYEGYYKDPADQVNIRGQVYLKRYSQPTGYDGNDPVYTGYERDTLYDSLFYVGDGGTLTLSGIYADGHAISSDSINPTLVAPAVVAQSPLITVEGSGVLQCYRADGISSGVPTATILANNVNANHKNGPEYVIGRLNDSDIMEGSSAGIELLNEATAILQYTEFNNLQLGDQVISGGTDVYSNGYLHFSYYTKFGGTVFLEGVGTPHENQETSRYLVVDVYGTPVLHNFKVQMRDPYQGRDVVHYQEGITATPKDAGYYLLEERVKDYFCLLNRSEYPHILELQVPAAVYIDGINGVDDQGDRDAGSTPASPVKTLKRAYELLTSRGGNTIYVVGAIQVNSEVQITGKSYIGSDGIVNLGSTDKVKIVRYLQPDFAIDDPAAGEDAQYDVADFTGTLLNIQDGATARLSSGVYLDGHSEPKTDKDLPPGAVVSRRGASKAALVTVEEGGTLTLLSDVTLYHNNNTFDPDTDSTGQHGGAVLNRGTTTVDGTLFENNKAARGAVAYQDGTFTILSAPEKMDHHTNAFYLTTVNSGTGDKPVWGTDHVIRTAVAIPDDQVFEVDMDHAVKGRDVVRFTANTAFDPNADAEHGHFRLGRTVTEDLFLVESEQDPYVLQLQNWEVLMVEVPTDIYLVMSQRGTLENTRQLAAVKDDPPSGDRLFTAPEYTVCNKGIWDARVSITGFENKTMDAGITADPDKLMNLTASASDAAGANDLYLAVRGLDDAAGGNGFGAEETSLQPYAEDTVVAGPLVLGTLQTQTAGSFTFVASAGSGFMEKFMDTSFPLRGTDKPDVQKYMDGTSDTGVIGAGAKYLLKYRIEMIPGRR